jgi:hypothetical protein
MLGREGVGGNGEESENPETCGGVVPLVRTTVNAGGRGFESRRSRQVFKSEFIRVSKRHAGDWIGFTGYSARDHQYAGITQQSERLHLPCGESSGEYALVSTRLTCGRLRL